MGEDDEEEAYDEEEEDEEDDHIPEDVCIILDNGSGMCKAGLSSEEKPGHVFPEVLGRPRGQWEGKMDKEFYVGDEAIDSSLFCRLHWPLENGIIESFDEMTSIWEYTFFDRLQANPMRHPILLTEPPYNPKPNRERMVEIMFETFEVPCLNVSIQGVLALLGQGRTTGIVLDSGEGVTHTIPIFDGFGLPHCINRMDIAGRELNTLLGKLLATPERGSDSLSLVKTKEQVHLRNMKEQHCYVALDPNSEYGSETAASYKLPDGRNINLREERWRTPEALFTPSLVGLESETHGVAGMVWDSISRCDIDTRRTLQSNVVLSGGSTMFPGFSERLTRELRLLAPTASQAGIRVIPSKDQKNAVWSGAQVFASLRSMQEDLWISFEDYEEHGAQIIHDKIQVKYS